MKKQVAVSFEDIHVRVVFASQDKGKTAIQRTVLLREEEFDAFLEANKLPNLSVVYPFRNFYSDVVSVPPVKKSYLKAIVESEIRKRFPDLNQFSFCYSVLADKSPEEKKLREVFFLAVDNREIDQVIQRFERHGKTVKFIYPDTVAVSHFIQSCDDVAGKNVLGFYASEMDNVLLLIKNGQLRFIRVTPSTGKRIQDTDIDNINMTTSYCWQSLRLNPEQLVVLNVSTATEATSGRTVIPVIPIDHPAGLAVPEETYRDDMAPLAAILFRDRLKNDSLLPQRYSVLYNQRFAVAYAILFFLLFSLIGLSYLTMNLTEVLSQKEKINRLRKDLSGTETIISAYDKNAAGLQMIIPLIQFINDVRSGPDMQKKLTFLDFLPMDRIDIQSVQMNNKKDVLQLQLSGKIESKNYGDMHNTLQKLLNGINKGAGMVILSRNMELKNGRFQIEAEAKIP
ncbi:MAG: hypothetical protein KKG96_01555 [Proteobacteria bacterium]|nr:hypothetical protein [Pseudomonadota bacterium]